MDEQKWQSPFMSRSEDKIYWYGTYKFLKAVLWDHCFYLADAITQRQLGRNNQLGLRLLRLIALFTLLLLLLLWSIEHFVVRYLKNEALILLEFVYGCIGNGENAIFGEVGRRRRASYFGCIVKTTMWRCDGLRGQICGRRVGLHLTFRGKLFLF